MCSLTHVVQPASSAWLSRSSCSALGGARSPPARAIPAPRARARSRRLFPSPTAHKPQLERGPGPHSSPRGCGQRGALKAARSSARTALAPIALSLNQVQAPPATTNDRTHAASASVSLHATPRGVRESRGFDRAAARALDRRQVPAHAAASTSALRGRAPAAARGIACTADQPASARTSCRWWRPRFRRYRSNGFTRTDSVGRLAVSISHRIAPSAYTSLRSSIRSTSPRACSGDM